MVLLPGTLLQAMPCVGDLKDAPPRHYFVASFLLHLDYVFKKCNFNSQVFFALFFVAVILLFDSVLLCLIINSLDTIDDNFASWVLSMTVE